MKKVILFLLLFIVLISPVYAKDNKLYFTEHDDRIYYESALFDENIFMEHTDMVPGKNYLDELIIENGANTKYTLYFKASIGEQSDEAEELLDNIMMKITLDDEVIYEGAAKGLNYFEEEANFQNAILLGDFTPSKNSKMVVETKLLESYDNTDFNDFSYLDWTFYVQYTEKLNVTPTEIIKSPNTMMNRFPFTFLFSILIILVGFGIIKYAYKKEN